MRPPSAAAGGRPLRDDSAQHIPRIRFVRVFFPAPGGPGNPAPLLAWPPLAALVSGGCRCRKPSARRAMRLPPCRRWDVATPSAASHLLGAAMASVAATAAGALRAAAALATLAIAAAGALRAVAASTPAAAPAALAAARSGATFPTPTSRCHPSPCPTFPLSAPFPTPAS